MPTTIHATIPTTNLTLVSINNLTKKSPWYRRTHAAAWRAAGTTAATTANLPRHATNPNAHATIHATIYKPRAGRYDPGNLYPCLKWAVDGLIDYGLLPDDDWVHLDGPHLHHGGKDTTNPRIELEITLDA